MDKRIIFSVLTSIFLISAFSLIFIQPASSTYYYEADDGWYGDAFWDEYDSFMTMAMKNLKSSLKSMILME